MSYCPKCGNELSDADEFCSKCGHHNDDHAPAKPSQPDSPSAAPSVEVAPRKKMSGCAIAAIVGGSLMALIGIVVVIVMVLAFSLTSPAVDAINAHLAALKQGQIEQAYQGTCSDFKSVTSIEAYRHFVDSYPVLKDVVDASFSERLVENGLATLKGQITDSQGNVTTFNAQLREEGGEWKVLAIDLPNVQAMSSPRPTASNVSSVGKIVIGAGRNGEGELVNPGKPLSTGSSTLSADVEMINHAPGESVEVWIELNGKRSDPIAASISGEGSFSMPVDIDVREAGFSPNRYLLVVSLGGKQRFSQEFEIK